MKVTFFNYLPLEYGGGTGKYFLEISSGLTKRYKDLDVSIITFDKELAEKIIFLYSLYYGYKNKNENREREEMSSLVKKLARVSYHQAKDLSSLKKMFKKIDTIYCKNDLFELLILKYGIGYKNLPPVIIGCHTTLLYPYITSFQSRLHNLLYNSRFYLHLLREAKIIHVINSSEERYLKNNLSVGRVIKIHNPFDFQMFTKNASFYRFKLKLEKKKLNILWVGKLIKEKGVKDLLATIETINQLSEGNKISWNIIGSGEMEPQIRKCVQKWKNVRYFGYVENNYLASIYKENDIFISTSAGEGFPYTILEAQCFGLPVIAYKNNGTAEILQNHKTGILVLNREQFIRSLISYIHRPSLSRKYIKEYVRFTFNNEVIFSKLYEMFKEQKNLSSDVCL